MSFREKIAWISLASMTGVFGLYFWWVVQAGLRAAHHPAPVHFGGLLGTIIALVIVEVALITVAAIFAPRDAKAPRDERDRLIELRSTRTAYSALATAVVFACFFGAMDPPIVFNANSLLFILVTAEILRYACVVIQYRRA